MNLSQIILIKLAVIIFLIAAVYLTKKGIETWLDHIYKLRREANT